MAKETKAQTLCYMCGTQCGLEATVRENKLVKVGPVKNHYFPKICIRAGAIPDWLYSKERITHPMRRVNGDWKRITWEEALDVIASKLKSIREEFGGQAVAIMDGQNIHTGADFVARRFANVYGTPNYMTDGSFCEVAKMVAGYVTFGYLPYPNIPPTKCLVLWGTDPSQSAPTIDGIINAPLKEGAKLLVVDPRTVGYGPRADVHAKLRPGSDGAFALGLINVVISEGLYDKEFVKNWTIGFDELADLVKDYPPERVEKITWVPADTIKEFARIYATSNPAAVRLGNGVDHHVNGFSNARAVLCLEAICGNIAIRGGNIEAEQPKIAYTWKVKDYPAIKAIGEEEHSLWIEYCQYVQEGREAQGVCLPNQVLTEKPYPVKALILFANNPLVTWPNSNNVRKALSKLDLLVVKDFYMIEGAKELAHIFLPTTSFLEQQWYTWHNEAAGMNLLTFNDKILEPLDDCWPDERFWISLGKRMGFNEYFPWEDEGDFHEDIMKQMGKTIDEAKSLGPRGFFYAPRRLLGYKENGFNTPSGKIELRSSIMEKYGHNPLPEFVEPPESPMSRPDLFKEYPLIITSGGRTKVYTHTRFRYVEKLRKLRDPEVEINPKDAERYKIENGSWVNVSSPRGSIKVKAVVTDNILPGVAHIYHGWPNGINTLTDDAVRDPVSGYGSYRSLLGKISMV